MTTDASATVLEVRDLRVEIEGGGAPIVEDVSIALRRGEILGLVGESGSGKTTTALALLGYARPGARIAGGEVVVDGHALIGRTERDLRRLRGRAVAYVPQNPGAALNPAFRIADQIREMLRGRPVQDVGEALERVHLPADRAFARRYPHQLSGGQQQRVAIAAALVGEPPVVVLDEPTTGLDVVTQARILDEIRRLRDESGLAMVYVSHDLAVVGSISDRIAVMYAGRVVEEGSTEQVLGRPRHPYTRGLVASIPDHAAPRRLRGIEGVAVGVGERPPGCAFAPRCPLHVPDCDAAVPPLLETDPGRRVRCIRWELTSVVEHAPPHGATTPDAAAASLLAVQDLRAEHRTRAGTVVAASDVSFAVGRGECIALVGESGSGKTTIARCVVGLHAPTGGRILLDGTPLAASSAGRSREERRRVQIVFQNPDDSLNPRHSVRTAVARPIRVLLGKGRREAEADVAALLERVRLPARLADRYPRELSGGERQRVAIARALAAGPELLVCDEVTSALDVSVQAAVLELLGGLRAELGLALLFISHDLGVVASAVDRVLVLDRGRVCEEGPPASLLVAPRDDYTRALVAAAPTLPAYPDSTEV